MRRAWRIAWTISLGAIVLTLAELMMLPCTLLGQRGRRINTEIIGRGMARFVLAYLGVRVRLHEAERLFPSHNAMARSGCASLRGRRVASNAQASQHF